MHMQTYTSADVYVGDVAEYPLDLSIGEGVREMLAEALELGVRVSPYVFPSDLKEGSTWTPFLPPEAVAYDRDGKPQGFVAVAVLAPGATGRGPRLDYGAVPGQRFFPTQIVQALVDEVGFGGIYNDVFSGSGPSLTYDPPPPLAAQHTAHGGDYWTRGKVRAIQLEREALHMVGPGSQEDRHRRSFVLSETAEEFVALHLDGFQAGYDWMPGHTLLAEEVIFGPAVSPPAIPLDAKNMAPALWDLVYHEWTPSLRFTIPLTDLPLARNAEVFPDGPYPGMSGDEWRDLVCFVFATNFAFGLGMNFLDYLNRDSPLVRVEGDQLVVDPAVDPDGEGLVVAAFLARLFGAQHAAYAGRFARLGRMERPLSVDWARWPAATRCDARSRRGVRVGDAGVPRARCAARRVAERGGRTRDRVGQLDRRRRRVRRPSGPGAVRIRYRGGVVNRAPDSRGSGGAGGEVRGCGRAGVGWGTRRRGDHARPRAVAGALGRSVRGLRE